MGKGKEKNPPVAAPVVEKEEEQKPAVNVMQMGDLDKIKEGYTKNGGLDPNHRVDVLMGIKTYFKDDPNAAANVGIPQEAVDKINGIAAIGFVAALGDEIMMGQSGWAHKMRLSQIEAINSVQELTGISIDVKALPAPDSNGMVEVKSESIKVSKKTKKELAEAKKVNDDANSGKKEYLDNHTLIETDEQLKEALGFQLVNVKNPNPVDRLVTAAQFYRSYLEARAEKSDNAEAELAKIHELTLANLLQDIVAMGVPPTFITKGFGKLLCVSAETANSVVSSFNMFKRTCFDKATKKYKYSDEEIAAFVRVLIVWYATTQIAELGKSIETHNNNIKTLNKDAKANAKAIESENEKIKGCNSAISHFQDMITLTTDPSFELINELPEAYNNKEHASHKYAELIVKSVMETYYKNMKIDEIAMPIVVLNAQQYAGMTLNLFRNPLAKCEDFCVEKLLEVPESKEEPAAEEATEEGKNA